MLSGNKFSFIIYLFIYLGDWCLYSSYVHAYAPKVQENKINTHTVVALNSSQEEKAESSQLAGLHSSNVTLSPPEALFIQILLHCTKPVLSITCTFLLNIHVKYLDNSVKSGRGGVVT
jgi:hypothetical protein